MLLPIEWLKEYTQMDEPVDTFREKMIMSGSNIETVEHFGEGIEKVVVCLLYTSSCRSCILKGPGERGCLKWPLCTITSSSAAGRKPRR